MRRCTPFHTLKRAGAGAEGAECTVPRSNGASGGAPSGGSGSRPRAEDLMSPPRPPPQNRVSWADVVCPPRPAPDVAPEPAAAPTAALRTGPCAGLSCALCRHCFCPLAAHEGGEQQCSTRRMPDPAVWTAYAAKQPHLTPKRETRAAQGGAVAAPHAGGHVQRGGRTPEQQGVCVCACTSFRLSVIQ